MSWKFEHKILKNKEKISYLVTPKMQKGFLALK